MDELIALCSQTLRQRLTAGGEEATVLRMEMALSQLNPLAELIMRWRYGLGCLPLTRQHMAERIEVSTDQMEELERCALLDLGFMVLAVLDAEEDDWPVAA